EPFRMSELSPHVTVVVGPNASGKSSLVRALRCLFSPGLHAGQPTEVVGEFRAANPPGAGATWRATRPGAVTTSARPGATVHAPPPPPDHLLNSSLVSIETLVRGGPTGASIGALLRKEMTGGYDLPSARAAVTPGLKGHRNAAIA